MQKRFLLFILMVPLSVFTTDLYMASFPEISKAFSASPLALQLSQSAYFIGFALSTLMIALLAEKFGCKKVLNFGLLSYVLGTTVSLSATSMELLILGRLLQSIGGSSTSILTRTMVTERSSNEESARTFTRMFLIVSIVMIGAPLLGSFFIQVGGWQTHLLFLLALGILYLFSSFTIQENHEPKEKPASFLTLFKMPTYLFYTGFTALSWASLVGFVTLSPFLISFYYGHSPFIFGLLYGLMIFFFILGNRLSKPNLRSGVRSILLGSLLLSLSYWTPTLSLFLIASFFFLFGIGYTIPQTQIRAITQIQGRTSYGFALMYFAMMTTSAFGGMVIANYAETPFFGAQMISLLGAIQIGIYFVKVRKAEVTSKE